jgi:hypothetical protein
MGAGATRRFSAVRWGVARRIAWAWIFTIPASAALAALVAVIIKAGVLALTLAVLVSGMAALALLTRGMRRKRPSTDDFGIGPIGDPNTAGKAVERESPKGSTMKVGK